MADGGFQAGENLDLEILDSNDIGLLESSLIKALDAPTDLIHAVGTPNALIAAGHASTIPIVYYGAHPEHAGESECRTDNICGVVLTLPFTSTYKNFRFIRKLIPGVNKVYVPFYEGTVFCSSEMKKKHRHFRTSAHGSPWIPMDSPLVGYRTLAALCSIIDLEYNELVYHDEEDLVQSLGAIECRNAVLMPFNDSVYCGRAPSILSQFGIEMEVPLVWNNNAEATQIGALAGISSCFKEAGLTTGKMASALLNGAKPSNLGFVLSAKTYASINMNRARQLHLSIPAEVLNYFDEALDVSDRKETAGLPARTHGGPL
jgi:ABC-type uncharacterized transport system substrate-binding protein